MTKQPLLRHKAGLAILMAWSLSAASCGADKPLPTESKVGEAGPKAPAPPSPPPFKAPQAKLPKTAFHVVVLLQGEGKYRAVLDRNTRIDIGPGQIADYQLSAAIPRTLAFREIHRLHIFRTYETDGSSRTAAAVLQIPVLGFGRPQARTPIRLGELVETDCRTEGKAVSPRSEGQAIRTAVMWENVIAACAKVKYSENPQIYAFEHALYAQKWLVQNFPEDYAVSADLRERARDLLRSSDRCIAGKCKNLETEVNGTQYIDYKLYDPLSKLSHRGLDQLSDGELKSAAATLVVAENAYNACRNDRPKSWCDFAEFPQLRLDICTEVARRQRSDIQTCPLPAPRAQTPAAPQPGSLE